MKPISAVDFRNRQMEVKVFDRCDKCETLKDDVKERANYWPRVKATTCCGVCFAQLVAEAQGLIVCC